MEEYLMGVAAASSFQFLTELGAVPPAYWHEWRVAAPQAPLILPNAVFKWYHIHR